MRYDHMNRESLERAVATMHAVLPGLTDAEAGFHSALALFIGYLANIMDNENKTVVLPLVEFALEAGQQISGPEFRALADALRQKKGDVC